MFQRTTEFILDSIVTAFAVLTVLVFMVVMVVVLAIGDAVFWLFGKKPNG